MIKYKQLSIGDRLISKNETTESLEALVDTLNFIDVWLKLFEENYDERCVAYSTAMKEMSKQITLTAIKALTPKKNSRNLWQKLMVDGIWEKVLRD